MIRTLHTFLVRGSYRTQVSEVISRAYVHTSLIYCIVVCLSGSRRAGCDTTFITIKSVVCARANQLAGIGRQVRVIIIGGLPGTSRIALIVGS